MYIVLHCVCFRKEDFHLEIQEMMMKYLPTYGNMGMYMLYGLDEDSMKAHQGLDRAVMMAYGFPVKGTTESLCVAELMKRYKKVRA